MAAVRSLTQELAGAEQLVENLVRGGGAKWRRDAIRHAQQRVRQLRAAIKAEKP